MLSRSKKNNPLLTPSPDEQVFSEETQQFLTQFRADYRRRRRRERLGSLMRVGLVSTVSIASSVAVRHFVDDEFTGGPVRLEVKQDCSGLNESFCSIGAEIGKVASDTVGRTVEAYCNNLNSPPKPGQTVMLRVDGLYMGPPDISNSVIYIDTFTCAALLSAQGRPLNVDGIDVSTQEEAFAVFAVAHEIAHAKGTADEGQANCEGMDLYRQVGKALGVNHELLALDPVDIVASVDQPAQYHTAGC